VLTAPLALAWIERGRPRRLSPWKLTYGLVAAGVLLVVVYELARGRSVTSVFGGYSVIGHTSYRFWPVLEWIVLHLAGLALAVWVIPFAATVVVLASARHLDRPLRVFAAVTASLGVWLVLEVGVFASRFSGRIEERNLFYLVPLMLIALLAWIERGQPRPPRATVFGALAAVALVGAIPFTHLLNENAESDTPFLQPWWWLGSNWTGKATVTVVASVTALALAALFLWLPARFAPWLPAVVAVGFVLTWLPLEASPTGFPQQSVHFYDAGIAAGTSWVDAITGPNADVAVLWSGGDTNRIWQNEFWNRSIRRVYGVDQDLPGGMPQERVSLKRGTNDLVGANGEPVEAQYVLADSRLTVQGEKVGGDDAHQLVLYRVDGPLRLQRRVTGWYDDFWTGPVVTWTRGNCTGGALKFDLRTDAKLFAGVVQHIDVSGSTPRRTLTLKPTDEKVVQLPLTSRNGTCTVRLDMSQTRVPASYPQLHNSDPRRLGAQVDYFTYVPPK